MSTVSMSIATSTTSCTIQEKDASGKTAATGVLVFDFELFMGGLFSPMKGRSHFDPMTPMSAAEAQGFLLTSESMRTST